MTDATRLGTRQYDTVLIAALYSANPGRCVCEDTVTRQADGVWRHGFTRGEYCRDSR